MAIPTYKYLSKGNVEDNEFVKGQVIINPEAKSPAILDRTLNIKFIAKVDKRNTKSIKLFKSAGY